MIDGPEGAPYLLAKGTSYVSALPKWIYIHTEGGPYLLAKGTVGGWPLPPCQRDSWRVALTSLPKGFLLAPPQQVPSGTVVGVPPQQVPSGTVGGAMEGGPYLLAKGIVSTALNSAMHSGFCLTAFYTLLPASLLVKPFTPWQDG